MAKTLLTAGTRGTIRKVTLELDGSAVPAMLEDEALYASIRYACQARQLEAHAFSEQPHLPHATVNAKASESSLSYARVYRWTEWKDNDVLEFLARFCYSHSSNGVLTRDNGNW